MENQENKRKSLVESVVEEYLSLQKLEPNHPNLRYISKVEEKSIMYDKENFGDYLKRFGGENKNLFFALENYKNKLESDLERVKKYVSSRTTK